MPARASALGSDRELRLRMSKIASLSADHCLLADSQRVRGLAIEPEDYPQSLRRANIQGGVKLAYSRTADRHVKDLRVLVAEPPMLFDDGTKAMLTNHPPIPAERDGKPAYCVGQISNVNWQLQEDVE